MTDTNYLHRRLRCANALKHPRDRMLLVDAPVSLRTAHDRARYHLPQRNNGEGILLLDPHTGMTDVYASPTASTFQKRDRCLYNQSSSSVCEVYAREQQPEYVHVVLLKDDGAVISPLSSQRATSLSPHFRLDDDWVATGRGSLRISDESESE